MAERYELIRKVAQGGFGKVYVALDRTLKREVAIKRLLSKNEGPEAVAAEEAFQREAQVLAAMQHPNIVQIFDFDQDEEGSFVVMEMLEGKTLRDAIDLGALTWDDFTKLVRQSLDAMVAAHKADILHRDLKPENIFLKKMVTGGWTVKVLDFGLAKLSAQPSRQTMDQKGNVFGSIYYMAPEQFKREALDARTDIYALGCVYYQALTQRLPFYADTVTGTMEAHLKHQMKPLVQRRTDTPPAIAAWLERLIARHRDARPPDAITAKQEFEDALQGKMPPPAVIAAPVAVPVPVAVASATLPVTQVPASRPASSRPGPGPGAPGRPRSMPPQTPVTTRSLPPPSRASTGGHAVSPALMEARRRQKRAFLFAGIAVLLAVAFVAFLSSRGRDSARPAATSQGTPKPAAPSTPPPAPLPAEPPLALPSEEKLAWRFRAGAETWYQGGDGRQARTAAQRNQRVHAWKSLAPQVPNTWMRPLSGRLDWAATILSSDVNGAGTNHRYLFFSTGWGMEQKLDAAVSHLSPGNGVEQSFGVTIAAVFRANGVKKDKTMRPLVLASSWSKDTLSLHFSHLAGQYWATLHHGGAMVMPTVRPQAFEQKGAGSAWVVAVATWDAKAGKVSMMVRSPDGKVARANEASVPPGMPMMDKLHLGAFPFVDGTKLDMQEKMDGDIIEVAVYREAFDQGGRDRLMNALWDQYFRKK